MPCGAAAQTVAENAGVTLTPVSEEQSVTDVLAKVTSGEADAGLVYVTDVQAAGDDVEGITFPESGDGREHLPDRPGRAAPTRPTSPRSSSSWSLGDTGQGILADAGFGQPDA